MEEQSKPNLDPSQAQPVTDEEIKQITNKWYEIYENESSDEVANSYDAIYYAIKEYQSRLPKQQEEKTPDPRQGEEGKVYSEKEVDAIKKQSYKEGWDEALDWKDKIDNFVI